MKRSYSDVQVAEALAVVATTIGADGKPNYSEASRQTGIARKTLESWHKGERRQETPESAQMCLEKKGDLANNLEALAQKLVGKALSLTDTATDLQRVMTGAGIAIDKMQLLRGQPTNIDKHLSDEDVESELNELLNSARKRAGQIPAGTEKSA